MSPKLVKFKAHFGDIDNLNINSNFIADQEFVMLTNNTNQDINYKTQQFTIDEAIKILKELNLNRFANDLNNQLMNRIIKIYPFSFFKNSKIIVYCDSHILVKEKLEKILKDFSNSNFEWLGLPHRYSRFLKDEAISCYLNGKIDKIEFKNYVSDLNISINKYPLFECGFIIRKNTDKVREASLEWLSRYLHGPRRDQLHISKALISHKINYDYLKFSLHDKIILQKLSHKKNFIDLNYSRFRKILRLIYLTLSNDAIK